MAKKGKTTNRAKAESSIVNNKSQVWHIFHFAQRFELPDDMKICRKSGLQYTKRFVGVAGGDEAVGYHSQFAMLQNGDGLESCLLEGIYGRLVNMAAQHSFAKRGYLIDAADEPLTARQIGRMLHINGQTMSKYLRLFESVKLLERCELPRFDMTLNESQKGKKAGKGETSENSGKFRKPLKNDKTAKQPNGCKDQYKQKATGDKTAVAGRKKNNGNSADTKVKAQNKGGPTGQGKDEPPSAPTTTPPIKPIEPHGSDDGGLVGTDSPPDSVEPTGKRVRNRRAVYAGVYDKFDEHYGTKVYKALGYRRPIDSPQARREICSFASKWHQCRERLSGLDPPRLDKLAGRAIAEAVKIGKRKANRKPAAVWNDLMDDLMDAEIRRAM